MRLLSHRNPTLVALAVLGDLLVFVLFIVLAPVEHGMIQIEAFGRTALPFAGVWFIASPWLGAFRVSTLTRLRLALWRVPLIWLGCGIVAVMLRVWLTDRTFSWAFTLASIGFLAAMLLAWRSALALAARKFTHG